MSWTEKLETILRQHRVSDYVATQWSIRVPTANNVGFDVTLEKQDNEFVLFCGGWHEHFDDELTACEWFAAALTPLCRVQMTQRWGIDYRWTLQTKHGNEWKDDYVTGLLIFPFFGRINLHYLSNNTLPASLFSERAANHGSGLKDLL